MVGVRSNGKERAVGTALISRGLALAAFRCVEGGGRVLCSSQRFKSEMRVT